MFSEDLRDAYKIIRKKPQQEQWPPYQPSSIVNVTVMHYKNQQRREELIKISEHLKTDTHGIDKLASAPVTPPSHSRVTKEISEIFKTDLADQIEGSTESKSPKLILIEGAPGIGKTVLAKEIAYLWAQHKLLTDCKLLIFAYLRDPRVHAMKSVEELIQLYTNENDALEIKKYLEKSQGQNVVFVFDGFDEFPTSQEGSLITDIIGMDGNYAQRSIVVVTSRPTATLYLRKLVDRRIEILGFAPEEREKLISQFVSESPHRRTELEKYFKQHPIISGLCYIPLNLAILLYLFDQNALPETLTEMNESFVIHTIYRDMEKTTISSSTGCICHLTDLPRNILEIICKVSKLAFVGLQKDQLVFTYDALKETCPEVINIPEAANGFSLLQAVQHHPRKGAGKTVTFNFLHLTMQEFLAAYYVSTLPEEQQLELLQKTFWDGHFNFMWMMYVGIVGIKSDAFTSFLKTIHRQTISVTVKPGRNDTEIFKHIENMRYLHLFQCYTEAKSDTEMPQKVSTIFSDGIINFTDITLLPHHVTSLLLFMFTYSRQQWKSFTLSQCNLQRTEMNNLLYNIVNNKEKMSNLGCIDLSKNGSSPWGIYSFIIRHCCVDSLALCGDEGMNEYIEEITDSLQVNTAIQTLTLFGIGKVGVESIKTVLLNNLNLETIKLSWQAKDSEYVNANTVSIRTVLSSNTNDSLKTINKSYNVYVCYASRSLPLFFTDDQHDKPESIYLSGKNLNDDAVHVLAFGLCNNTTVEELHMSNNEITDEGAVAIIDCLKHNNTIKKLDLSRNKITTDGMNKMTKNIEKLGNTLSLEYVDMSNNGSSLQGYHHANIPSPWGVYCAIIRRCCVDSLTLHGDVGMNEYTEEITDSLQANATLQSLTLFSIGTIGVQVIKAVLMNNSTLKKLNISFIKTDIEIALEGTLLCRLLPNSHVAMHSMKERGLRGVRNIIFMFDVYMNNKILFILFSGDVHNQIFKPNSINLSDRNIFADGFSLISFWLCNNTMLLEELDVSDNVIDEKGVTAIIDILKCNRTLKKLDVSKNLISDKGMNEMLKYIDEQGVPSLLEYIDLSGNGSSQWGVYCAIISHCGVNNLTLCGDEDIYIYTTSEEIIKRLDINKTLQSLTLCNVDEKVYNTLENLFSDDCEELCKMETCIQIGAPAYIKSRCYSLNSSDAIDGKVTVVMKISEKQHDHLPNANNQCSNDKGAHSSGPT